jgi:hypothetical protein
MVVYVVAAAALSVPAHAQIVTYVPQAVAVVDTGARVRLQVTKSSPSPLFGPQRLEGRIQRLDPDTLHLQLSEPVGLIAIPRTHIRRLESSIGSPSRFENIVEGAMAGAGIMGIYIWSNHLRETGRRYERDWHAVVSGAGLGMLMGGYLKSRWPLPEHWRPARFAR